MEFHGIVAGRLIASVRVIGISRGGLEGKAGREVWDRLDLLLERRRFGRAA